MTSVGAQSGQTVVDGQALAAIVPQNAVLETVLFSGISFFGASKTEPLALLPPKIRGSSTRPPQPNRGCHDH